jgi:hypothetical protein
MFSTHDDAGCVYVYRFSSNCSLGQAARLQRSVLLCIRGVFPEWGEHIVKGEPRAAQIIDVDDEQGFVDAIVRSRVVPDNSDFVDPNSKDYNEDSIPFRYASRASFYLPNPKKPRFPHPNDAVRWGLWTRILSEEGHLDNFDVAVPFCRERRDDGAQRLSQLVRRLALLLSPVAIRYAINAFDKTFWHSDFRIGWINYFGPGPLADKAIEHPRAERLNNGVFLQLSDSCEDMRNEDFARETFAYSRELLPYWELSIKY